MYSDYRLCDNRPGKPQTNNYLKKLLGTIGSQMAF